MGEYELIIFLTEDKVSIMEVDYNGQTKIVGFHGDDYFSYSKNNDLDDLYKIVCDTYNIDDLSELDINVFLIDCGMEIANKWYLIDKLKSCKSLSINSLSSLLPILLSKKGLLKVGDQTVVEFLEKKYAYICDNEYHVEEINTRGKNAQYVLSMDDFSFIAVWKGNLSQNNKELEEKLLEINKLQQNQNSYEKKIKEYQEKYDELEVKYNELKVKMDKEKEQEKEKQDNAKKQEMVNNRRYVEIELDFAGLIMPSFIKQHVNNYAIVSENQKIGGVFYSRSNPNNSKYDIYAPRAGKIIWLQLDCDELLVPPNRMFSSHNKVVVAIIGDESDDVSDMKEWLLERTREYTKPHDTGHSYFNVLKY